MKHSSDTADSMMPRFADQRGLSPCALLYQRQTASDWSEGSGKGRKEELV